MNIKIVLTILALILTPYLIIIKRNAAIDILDPITIPNDITLIVLISICLIYFIFSKKIIKDNKYQLLLILSPTLYLLICTYFLNGYDSIFVKYLSATSILVIICAYIISNEEKNFDELSRHLKFLISILILIYFIEIFWLNHEWGAAAGIGNRNWLVGIFIIGMPFMVYDFIYSNKKVKIFSGILLCIIITINYLYLKNKFFYLAFPIILITQIGFLIFLQRKINKLILVLLALAVILAFFDKNFHLLFNINKLADRYLVWELALKIIFENKFLGSGLGNFWNDYHQYKNLIPEIGLIVPSDKVDYEYIHNQILEVFYEGGAIQFLIQLIILLYILYLVINFLNNTTKKDNEKFKVITILTSLIIFIIHSFIDLVLVMPINKFLFYFLLFYMIKPLVKININRNNFYLIATNIILIFSILISVYFTVEIFINNKNCYNFNYKSYLKNQTIEPECKNPRRILDIAYDLSINGKYNESNRILKHIQVEKFMDLQFLEIYNLEKIGINNSHEKIKSLSSYLPFHRGAIHLSSQYYIKNNNLDDFIEIQKKLITKLAFEHYLININSKLIFELVNDDKLIIEYTDKILKVSFSEKFMVDLMILGSGKYGCGIIEGFKNILMRDHLKIISSKEAHSITYKFSEDLVNEFTSYCLKYEIFR